MQPGNGPGLSLKACLERVVLAQRGGQDLECHDAIQAFLARLIDVGHAAPGHLCYETVTAQDLSGQIHTCPLIRSQR